MTLNELINKLDALREQATGNGDLPVFISDWSEWAYSPEPLGTFQVTVRAQTKYGESTPAKELSVLFEIEEEE